MSARTHDAHEHAYEITSEMIDDILTAAFEGGIYYWCPRVEVVGGTFPQGARWASEVPARGGTLRLHILEDEPRHMDRSHITRGIRKAAAHFGLTPEAFHEDHDAIYADVAVQFAILNEIRFG